MISVCSVLSSAAPAAQGASSDLALCLKNCTSAVAQLLGHVLLLVMLASAYSMLRNVSESPCCTPNIISSMMVVVSEAFVSRSLQERLEGSTVRRQCLD